MSERLTCPTCGAELPQDCATHDVPKVSVACWFAG